MLSPSFSSSLPPPAARRAAGAALSSPPAISISVWPFGSPHVPAPPLQLPRVIRPSSHFLSAFFPSPRSARSRRRSQAGSWGASFRVRPSSRCLRRSSEALPASLKAFHHPTCLREAFPTASPRLSAPSSSAPFPSPSLHEGQERAHAVLGLLLASCLSPRSSLLSRSPSGQPAPCSAPLPAGPPPPGPAAGKQRRRGAAVAKRRRELRWHQQTRARSCSPRTERFTVCPAERILLSSSR